MKKLYTFVFMCLSICPRIYAQTPDFLWAKSAGGAEIEEGKSICTDASGNVYVTGYFESPNITFGSTTLTSAGWVDIFVVKYDAAGNVLWATSAGGTNNEEGKSICTDAGGNVYVTGYFNSPSITFGSTTLINTGSYDIFVVKYDAAGNVLWATNAGGTGYDDGTSIATDAGGNVYVAGYFWSPSITFGSTTLTNDGWVDLFVVKYDAAGNVLWATDAGGTNYDYGLSLATDASGHVYVTGYFVSPSITFGTTTLINAGNRDVFVVKYDASGNVLWATGAGEADYDYGLSLASDASGHVYVSGYFRSPSITFGTTTLTNAGNGDIFIVKYDAGGNVLWAKSEGGIDEDYGLSLATDASGNPHITGFFWSYTITFGSTTLTNTGVYDVFVVKYDAGGNVLWATGAGGTNIDWGLSLSTHAGGDVYIAGAFSSPSITFGSTSLINTGSYDIFVTKLGYVTSLNGFSGHSTCINIYPNPSSGVFTIHSQEKLNSIEIFNVTGERIYHAQGDMPSAMKLDINDQPAGIYFIRIKSKTSSIIKKLILSD